MAPKRLVAGAAEVGAAKAVEEAPKRPPGLAVAPKSPPPVAPLAPNRPPPLAVVVVVAPSIARSVPLLQAFLRACSHVNRVKHSRSLGVLSTLDCNIPRAMVCFNSLIECNLAIRNCN